MHAVPDAKHLHAVFDAPSGMTVGIEEEIMLLDADRLDLLPRAAEVIEHIADPAVGAELPASQIELRTAPHGTVPDAMAELSALRRRVAAAAEGIGRPAGISVHPFAQAEGVLNSSGRYAELVAEYGSVARRQLVAAVHVHVALRPAECAVAVYNAIRAYLPDLAAFAANSPFHQGIDSGLASVRPTISRLLPRQGVPPILTGVEQLAEEYEWGVRAGALRDTGSWWWEARLNPRVGTLEVRVADAQCTVGDTGAVAALVQCLAAWLAGRYDAGRLPPPAPAWRIEHNHRKAFRSGLDARMSDVDTGGAEPARVRWARLLDELGPIAERLGCGGQIADAKARLGQPTVADVHRGISASVGLTGLVARLADRFLEPWSESNARSRVAEMQGGRS